MIPKKSALEIMILTESSECWVGSIGSNTTLIVLAPGHPDIAILSPVSTPAKEMKMNHHDM